MAPVPQLPTAGSSNGEPSATCGKSRTFTSTPHSKDNLEEGEIKEADLVSLLRLTRSFSSPVVDQNKIASCTAATSPHHAMPETMTEEELDRAKSVVLDLLGWGVTPEYLVDYGVSPGALVRIFSDLNLRLPTNLLRSNSPPVVENNTP